jgi:hypothetical protein
MTRGNTISPDVWYIVIRLSLDMKPEAIATYTGISKRSVCRILNYFNQYGTIEEEKEHQKKGVHLRDVDLEVSNYTFSITSRD